MKILVSGASGLIGSALVPFLRQRGHQVTCLVRHDQAKGDTLFWDPLANKLDADTLEGFQGVVHLAGENIVGYWNKKKKERILSSRVLGTRLLSKTLGRLRQHPKVLVSASGINYYGEHGDELVTEASPPGHGFLAQVAQEWEAATQDAHRAGIRTACLRFGPVLTPRGGALASMLRPFSVGIGGTIGSGKQYLSWITLDDVLGIILHTLTTESLYGPVNTVAPNPVTNYVFTKTLGKILHRPTICHVPAIAARLLMGEFAKETILTSIRVCPAQLLAIRYEFRHPEIEMALTELIAKR